MAAVPQNVLKVEGVTQKTGCELYLAIMFPILFNFELHFESPVTVQSEPKEQTCVCTHSGTLCFYLHALRYLPSLRPVAVEDLVGSDQVQFPMALLEHVDPWQPAG